MRPYTDITVLLDRSGSMQKIKAGMESGFNAFLEGHRTIPSTRLTLIEFDSPGGQWHQLHSGLDLCTKYTAMPIEDAPRLTLVPRGGTPLLDALCRAIDMTGKRFARMAEDHRPLGVLFVIITDGEENMSREFTRSDVFGRIRLQEDTYKWEFIYLGANQDAISEAAHYGIKMANAIDYGFTSTGSGTVMAAMTANTVNYASATSTGTTQPSTLSYTFDQRVGAADTDEALQKKVQTLTPPAGVGG